MPSTYFGQGLGWTLPSILFLWAREKCDAHGSGLYLGTLDRSSGLRSREWHQMRAITGQTLGSVCIPCLGLSSLNSARVTGSV